MKLKNTIKLVVLELVNAAAFVALIYLTCRRK